jgi:signal transduction histidine kinase/CheY-like chemotaxis protein
VPDARLDQHFLRLVSRLALPGERRNTARAIAHALGAEDLIIFVRDPALGLLLPAPGFQQTLPRGPEWRQFLDGCDSQSANDGVLPSLSPDKPPQRVVALPEEDGALALFIGGSDLGPSAQTFILLMPLVAAVFRREREAQIAQNNAHGARAAAEKAELLAATTDRARAALRDALLKADQANQAKDRFISSLSHELRTPLTPVLVTAASLLDDASLPEGLRSALTMIQQNIELEVRLIDDLLDLTRIINGKLSLKKTDCNLHTLIDQTLHIAAPDMEAKQLRLTVRKKAHNPWIWGDSARIQQVLWNLFKNAAKFTPLGGRVTIETRNTKTHLELRVSDTGRGIEEKFLKTIFLPFEQGEVAGEHRFGGLGLGLAISKAVVDLHHGLLAASSDGPGCGATFTLKLETIVPNDPATSGLLAAKTQKKQRQLRLLLVEDHAPTLQVVAAALSRSGHDVTSASTLEQALQYAQRQEFDAVLSDVGLPDGSGLDLMRTLRDSYGLKGIALTGYGMEDDVRRTADSGFVAHLTKPVRIADLRDALALHFQA